MLNKIYKNSYTVALIVISFFLSFLAFRGFLNNINLDFADLGSFPKYPQFSLNLYYYDWINQGVGFNGSSLPYSFIIYIYSSIFKNPGISEKVWFFSLIAIGILSMYALSKFISKNNRFITMIFPIVYIFNPVVSGLIFEGSINDTLTAYVFFPLLIYTLLKAYENTNIYNYRYILAFSLIYVYVYFWNPQISMWILPILGSTCIFYLISKNYNKIQKVGKIILITIFAIISIAITGALNDIILLISGNSNNVVVPSGTVSESLIDLRNNFGGQFSFSYWYVFLIIFIFLLILFKLIPKNEVKKFTILHYSLVVEAFIILVVWSMFRFKINNLTIIIAGKFTELAAYEPFLGVTLLFSLAIFDALVVFSNLNFSDVKGRDRMKILKLFRLRKVKMLFVLLIILIFIFPSFHYWRQNDVYSVSDYIENPCYTDNNYGIPKNINEIATWFYSHTNISQEYRTLFFPDALMTDEALNSYMPWTAEPNLPYGLWYELLNNQTKAFGKGMSLYGVEYLILYSGPYIKADGRSYYQGKARISPFGFPWDLSYKPEGSPENWSNILGRDIYLTPVSQVGNSTIYKNDLYKGIIYAFKWNSIDSISNIQFFTQYNNYFYKNSSDLLTNIWHGYHFGGVKNNWTLEQNGTLVGGPLPKNLSYTNLYQGIDLQNDSYYELNYTLSGKYLSNALIAIRFYNSTGAVVETWIPEIFSGNVTKVSNRVIFKTPESFERAVVFPTYSKTYGINNKTLLYLHLNVCGLSNLTKVNVRYNFINPTHGNIYLNRTGAFLILYSMSYNNFWEIDNHIFAKPLYNHYFNESFFILSGEKTYSISFEKESTHLNQIIITWVLFSVTFVVYMVMSLIPIIRRKKSG